jgi:predicted hotdog family 3-hydroxylacyl-ACP dehydratase
MPSVTLDRAAIARLVAHAGAMCLLHEVVLANEAGIVCRVVNHRDHAHPLRDAAGLSAVCGIEYAAQAMAVHGAMREGGRSAPGVLAALRDVTLHVERRDDIREDVLVAATTSVEQGRYLVYDFELHAGGRPLLSGRATVALRRSDP